MKKLLISLCLIIMQHFAGFAQSMLDTNILPDGTVVIRPSYNNLKTIAKMSDKEFTTTMKSYHYYTLSEDTIDLKNFYSLYSHTESDSYSVQKWTDKATITIPHGIKENREFIGREASSIIELNKNAKRSANGIIIKINKPDEVLSFSLDAVNGLCSLTIYKKKKV